MKVEFNHDELRCVPTKNLQKAIKDIKKVENFLAAHIRVTK